MVAPVISKCDPISPAESLPFFRSSRILRRTGSERALNVSANATETSFPVVCTLGIFLHLLLQLIFRQLHPNFINVRTAYASEIWAQLTKNHLTKTSTERFREYIVFCKWCSLLFIVSFLKKKAMARIVEHIAKVAAVGREKAKSDYRCDK